LASDAVLSNAKSLVERYKLGQVVEGEVDENTLWQAKKCIRK